VASLISSTVRGDGISGGVLQIAVVDDHPFLREALRSLLGERRPDISVVGEAATAREAVVLVQALRPDVIVMDILLPGQNGIAATREVLRISPACKVLIFTALAEPGFAIEALSAGAVGYALKSQSLDELIVAIDDISHGRRYLAPAVARALNENGDKQRWGDGFSALSRREKEVFDLVVAGCTNRQTAAQLFISVKTVETHRTRINRKLCIHSTAELIRFAAHHQMLSA
jgi:DNA-binding NarL/FixJ family response regulator